MSSEIEETTTTATTNGGTIKKMPARKRKRDGFEKPSARCETHGNEENDFTVPAFKKRGAETFVCQQCCVTNCKVHGENSPADGSRHCRQCSAIESANREKRAPIETIPK